MIKKQIANELEITEKQLDLLEYDFLKIHKEYIGVVDKPNIYPAWYIIALKEWKGKRRFLFEQSPPTL